MSELQIRSLRTEICTVAKNAGIDKRGVNSGSSHDLILKGAETPHYADIF